MDEPQIRYARATDGVNIAYFTMGSGPPLVIIDLPASNIQFELDLPLVRDAYDETIRGGVSLVRYDHRGFGMSDKWNDEFTTDAFVRDLEAVVDRLELPQFFLIAARGSSYPVALAYTRAHPERVWRMAAVIGGPPWEFVEAILDTPGADWQFMIETITRRVAGWRTSRPQLSSRERCVKRLIWTACGGSFNGASPHVCRKALPKSRRRASSCLTG
jgi:pimeloyl-ACP methyl ester carboxylesterase